MKIGKAVAIFKQIDSDLYTEEEKGLAISMVMNMPTHNGINKDCMLDVIRYMWGLCYEEVAE